MAKYHINPAGNASVCKAEQNCPFGDLEKDHYSNANDARQAYEKKQREPKKVKQYPSYDRTQSYEIAKTIQKQIGVGTFMTLGADQLMVIDGGLRFNARILPFNNTGERSDRPAKMIVEVKLNGLDYYDVNVYRIKGFNAEKHFERENVDAHSLSTTLYSLDYDGPEASNPRF